MQNIENGTNFEYLKNFETKLEALLTLKLDHFAKH